MDRRLERMARSSVPLPHKPTAGPCTPSRHPSPATTPPGAIITLTCRLPIQPRLTHILARRSNPAGQRGVRPPVSGPGGGGALPRQEPARRAGGPGGAEEAEGRGGGAQGGGPSAHERGGAGAAREHGRCASASACGQRGPHLNLLPRLSVSLNIRTPGLSRPSKFPLKSCPALDFTNPQTPTSVSVPSWTTSPGWRRRPRQRRPPPPPAPRGPRRRPSCWPPQARRLPRGRRRARTWKRRSSGWRESSGTSPCAFSSSLFATQTHDC